MSEGAKKMMGDEYEKKFAEMQKYIPFLEAMISRLQRVKDASREVQLHKMQQLHGILTSSKRKLKIETLKKCEDVLQKLHSKVEKGSHAGLNFPSNKKIEDKDKEKLRKGEDNKPGSSSTDEKSKEPKPTKDPRASQEKMNDTPASPSPPASPAGYSKTADTIPIIIPTESKHDYSRQRVVDKPTSPDHSETVPTKVPIIIPTEREGGFTNNSSDNVNSIASKENNHDDRNISSRLNNAPKNLSEDSRTPKRHLPAVSISSSAVRRIPLEKHRSSMTIASVDNDPQINVFGKEPFLSPKRNATKPATPLLVSPPRLPAGPPLSIDDLTELLNDGSVENDDKQTSQTSKDDEKRSNKDKTLDDSQKQDKDNNDKRSSSSTMSSKSFVLTQNDIDRESERRWEEVDKHIVKFCKGPPSGKLDVSIKKSDMRDTPMSPVGLDRGMSPRYDPHERKSIPVVDRYSKQEPPSMPDMNVINSAFSRLSEGDIANLVQTNLHIQTEGLHPIEEREIFQRRGNMQEKHLRAGPESEFRRENHDYHRGHRPPIHPPNHHPGNREYSNSQWGTSNHSPMNVRSPAQLSPMQHPYPPHPNNHPDKWNMPQNSGPGAIDNKIPPHHMQSQFSPSLNRIRTVVSPPRRLQDKNLVGPCEPKFPEDHPAPPMIPPLMSSPSYNAPPYRNANYTENRNFDVQYERPVDFQHVPSRQQWENNQINRLNEPGFHEGQRTRGPDGPYGSPGWNRTGGNEQMSRGRSNDWYPERPIEGNRGERRPLEPPHPVFSRRNERSERTERTERERSQSVDNSVNRFIREPRNIPEITRDSRFRQDQSSPQTSHSSSPPNTSTSRRDQRIIKELAPVTVAPTIPKSKEVPLTCNSRDPRRRNVELKESSTQNRSNNSRTAKVPSVANKGKETKKPLDIKSRHISEDNKTSHEKTSKNKETMQSPLESLYGVIDTAAKTGKGYGLQKFKIPKIRRIKELPPRPPTPPKPSIPISPPPIDFTSDSIREAEENWGIPPSSIVPSDIPSKSNNGSKDVGSVAEKTEEKKAEVSSTTDVIDKAQTKRSPEEQTVNQVVESETKVDTSTCQKDNLPEVDSKSKESLTKDSDGPKMKEEVTQEWIESLIRASLESGEGKKLLEQTKLLQKLGEALHAKKIKKIQKIIESESESSSAESEKMEKKKPLVRKKRRVIISESSGDECLADRLNAITESPKKLSVKAKQAQTKGSVEKIEPEINEKSQKIPNKFKKKLKHEVKEDVQEESKIISKVEEDKKVVDEKQDPPPESEEQSPTLPETPRSQRKNKRAPKKRRNSLEMLQEDIREMFISEGVITATGHRMCRLIKESPGNIPSIGESSKLGIYTSSSPDRQNFSHSDDGEIQQKPVRPKSRASKPIDSDEPKAVTKGGRRIHKRAAKVSKRYVTSSSDSEGDDEKRRVRSGASSTQKEKEIKENPGKSSTPMPEDWENEPVSRRSGRLNVRELRPTTPKIDPSKIAFESFSDDSFGLDVSSITSGIDISLHSDRKPIEDGRNSATNSHKKIPEVKSKTPKKNKNLNESVESRSDATSRIDDEASVASDNSISSSVASSVRKITSISGQVDTNDELISNILGEDDGNNDKNKELGSDGEIDADMDVEEPPVAGGMKKPQAKRKKKRKSWRMGIVTKKKKKKPSSIIPSSANEFDTTIDLKNETDFSEDSVSKTIQNVVDDCGSSMKLCIKDDKDLIAELKKLPENDEEVTPKFNLETLIEYAWTGQERYKCLLCHYHGKFIVPHYKTVHFNAEVLVSRLTVLDAKRAIDESRDETFIKLSAKVNSGARRKFTCRFCVFSTEGEKESTMEVFYEHCSTHTGEYRFKCKSCPYQTISKCSIRTHYYKLCRKNNEEFELSFIEEPVPGEELVHGYLCSICNFIQLKECNIKKHVAMYHKDTPDIEMIKINMSSYFGMDELNDSESELRSVEDSLVKDDSDDSLTPIAKPQKSRKRFSGIVDELEKNNVTVNKPMKSESSPSKSDTFIDDSESSPTKKLNAFVCPPELENKDDEIQVERKKKMQEILNNMGRKFQKDTTDQGLSITDKLKDKMTTSDADSRATRIVFDDEDKDEIDDTNNTENSASTDPLSIDHIENANDHPDDGKLTSDTFNQDSNSVLTVELGSDIPKNEHIDLDEFDQNESDKKGLKDPLVSLEDGADRTDNSDAELSDNDDMGELRAYVSDTSDDISESELPTDVHSLLRENIHTSSNPMMNSTIQRLAAQLQLSNNVSINSEATNESLDENREEYERSTDKKNDSEPRFMSRSNLLEASEKIKNIQEKSMDCDYDDKDSSNSNTPKNFIRLRRLSGDKLSSGLLITETSMETPSGDSPPATPAESQNTPEDSQSELTQNDEDSCSFFKIENVISLAPNTTNPQESQVIDDIRKAVATSPLKNVGVSVLKKSSPNILKRVRSTQPSPLENALSRFQAIAPVPQQQKTLVVSSIGRPVGGQSPQITLNKPPPLVKSATTKPPSAKPTSAKPAQAKPFIPLQTSTQNKLILPAPLAIKPAPIAIKPTPAANKPTLIAPHPGNIIQATPIHIPRPNGPTQKQGVPTLAKVVKLPAAANGKNYKIVKVVRPLTVLKTKDNSQAIVAPKLKTVDAYTAMLQAVKLRQLFKCMSRSCTFSTDDIDQYAKHFQQHADTFDKKAAKPPYDYQKCAYCCDSMATAEEMYKHYNAKHTFCSYQCCYCFYRALTQSYVELHQTQQHPGKPLSVIEGIGNFPPNETFDRRENVIPFVCNHECNKLFYVPEAFIAHLKMKHGASLSVFKCHICPATTFKADTLISHYKLHGIYKYQCLYCLFGSDGILEIHRHLSANHYNRKPQILERSLPPLPVRDKDVLLQLMIRDLDEKYKCSEIKKISDNPPTEVIARRARREVIHAGPDGIITGAPVKRGQQRILPRVPMKMVGQTEVIDLFDGEGNHILQPTMLKLPMKTYENASITRIAAAKKSLEKKSEEQSQVPAEKKTPECNSVETDSRGQLQTNQETELPIVYANERVKNQITNAVDPLIIPEDDLLCNDEFISVNLLDNPEFLESRDERIAGKFRFKKNERNEDKNDDSDIEILEDIPPIPKTRTVPKSLTIQPEIVEKVTNVQISGMKTEMNEFDDEDKSCEEIPPLVATNDESITENPITPVLNSPTQILEIKRLGPLTLDDIKDTGYTGKDLFKCGYEHCTFKASNGESLKTHIKSCAYANVQKILNCVHCNKRFVKVGFLIDHFNVHGLKRFGCVLCNVRYAVDYQASAHMKSKHKFAHSKLVPADPKNPVVDGLYNVAPVQGKDIPKKGKKGNKNKSKQDHGKMIFGPSDIDNLPPQAIYNREVQCAVCRYSNKVRTNIIRHLQLHGKDETVPETGPVNPVPCLDKKEKMFDKMVNLASSSHQNGRMSTGAPKIAKEIVTESEIGSLPKFVPEGKRYICGVSECNYLTINEDMLRLHMKALHSEEPYFRCPHCPPSIPGQEMQNILIDKLGLHLKMHDTRLYKCSHCNYHHYQRHVVERHLTDKHGDQQPYVKVIREIENPANIQQPLLEETDEGISDPDGNHWKCNICEHKCAYKTEMISHASSSHDEKAQFKCTLCQFKTSGKINFEQHIVSKHLNDPDADYKMVYERIKGVKKPTDIATPEPLILTGLEPFDTTPLWRRDMPRVRHIRGILFEEENESKKSESATKLGKRKSDAELSSKPAKIKVKSASIEGWSSPDKAKNAAGGSMKFATKRGDANNEEGGAYGPYGRPKGNQYTCTICDKYTSKYRQDMKDHLYREMNYWRWHCKGCGYLAISHATLVKHVKNFHGGETQDLTELQRKPDVEEWVNNVLDKQKSLMKVPGEIAAKKLKLSSSEIIQDDSEAKFIPPSAIKSTKNSTKTVDLAEKISNISTPSINDSDEEDDDNALIIDSKDEPVDEKMETADSENEYKQPESGKQVWTCKHCGLKFTKWRGFKIHVQVNHLKRLGYCCPYCDRSTNSEQMIHNHIRVKHAGMPDTVTSNPAPKGPELSAEFWKKEYGLIIPSKTKKRKRKSITEEEIIEDPEMNLGIDVCGICGFTAINAKGLKAHMRAHANKHTLKCNHCSFTANSEQDIWQHSEINHPHVDWEAAEISASGSSIDPPLHVKKRNIEDYSEDIEEETVPDPLPIPQNNEKQALYNCFYCEEARTLSLQFLREHWEEVHKEPNELSEYQTGVPFQYKETTATVITAQKLMKCFYCSKKGSYADVRTHSRKKHPNLPYRCVEPMDKSFDIWVCRWCNERMQGNKKTKHQNMFHSHLPVRFKRESEMQVKQKGYACPKCNYVSVTLSRMRKHVSKHVEVYECRRCGESFPNMGLATNHSTVMHPGLSTDIEGVVNIELMMAKVSQSDYTYISEDTEPAPNDIFRNLGVAKKSTTKQIFRRPSSSPKNTARKSTTYLPRYPPGMTFDIDFQGVAEGLVNQLSPRGFSYYGKPVIPVNLGSLSTTMAMSGLNIKLLCTKLAKLVNINPKVIVEDIAKSGKYREILNKAE